MKAHIHVLGSKQSGQSIFIKSLIAEQIAPKRLDLVKSWTATDNTERSGSGADIETGNDCEMGLKWGYWTKTD